MSDTPVSTVPPSATIGSTVSSTPSNTTATSTTDVFPSPTHLIPPADVKQMLDYQRQALQTLRNSNHSFVAFQDYASKSFDQITSLHASRVQKIERLRESLTEIFLRIRTIRMQLHCRTPGLGPWVEDEDAEQEEIEELKRKLKEEEELERQEKERQRLEKEQQQQALNTSGFIDGDTSLPYALSVPNSSPTSPNNNFSQLTVSIPPAPASPCHSSTSSPHGPSRPDDDAPSSTTNNSASTSTTAALPSVLIQLYSHCSLQIAIPNALTTVLRPLAASIPDSNLYLDPIDRTYAGRVPELHLTIYSKLADADLARLQSTLPRLPPLSLTLLPQQIYCFSKPSCDSLVIPVQTTPQFEQLVSVVSNGSPPSISSSWKPHVTLAYVKKGDGSKLINFLRSQVETIALQFYGTRYEFLHQNGHVDVIDAGAIE